MPISIQRSPGIYRLIIRLLAFLSIVISSAACSQAQTPPAATPAVAATSAVTRTPSVSTAGVWQETGAPPAPSFTAPPTVPTPTAELFPPRVCSPLEGMDLSVLRDAVSNPYHPPAPASDDPHHGADLADMDQNRLARSGRLVQAALPGTIAGLVADRFPYGSAVILETRLDDLPWLDPNSLPVPALYDPPNRVLTCPPAELPDWSTDRLSVYVLYAHLAGVEPLELGQELDACEPLGRVGDSGNALNPHLHFEARLGPSGARFDSMAHYTASASVEEMAAYCAWRVSGFFRTFDPFRLLREEFGQK
jgi:murein DD-endopeptidase MepM/ murein hydrolase activator NlpD